MPALKRLIIKKARICLQLIWDKNFKYIIDSNMSTYVKFNQTSLIMFMQPEEVECCIMSNKIFSANCDEIIFFINIGDLS